MISTRYSVEPTNQASSSAADKLKDLDAYMDAELTMAKLMVYEQILKEKANEALSAFDLDVAVKQASLAVTSTIALAARSARWSTRIDFIGSRLRLDVPVRAWHLHGVMPANDWIEVKALADRDSFYIPKNYDELFGEGRQ